MPRPSDSPACARPSFKTARTNIYPPHWHCLLGTPSISSLPGCSLRHKYLTRTVPACPSCVQPPPFVIGMERFMAPYPSSVLSLDSRTWSANCEERNASLPLGRSHLASLMRSRTSWLPLDVRELLPEPYTDVDFREDFPRSLQRKSLE